MIVLYSTGCPKCKVLKEKLAQSNVSYKEINDVKEMEAKGIDAVPVLEVDGNMLDFINAVKWVNARNTVAN